MLKSFSEIKKIVQIRTKERGMERDEEGRIVYKIKIRDDDEFLSSYSKGDRCVISEDAAAFIERGLEPVPYNEQLSLKISSDVITDEEEKEYTKAIHDYYADRYESSRLEKHKLTVIAAVMAIVGVIALSVMIALEVAEYNAVFTEVIDIFAWVFMWEAVDVFFLQCTLLRFKQKRYLALSDANIEYYKLNEEGNK